MYKTGIVIMKVSVKKALSRTVIGAHICVFWPSVFSFAASGLFVFPCLTSLQRLKHSP